MDARTRKIIEEIKEQEYRFGQEDMKYKIIDLINKEIEQSFEHNDTPEFKDGLYKILDQILKID